MKSNKPIDLPLPAPRMHFKVMFGEIKSRNFRGLPPTYGWFSTVEKAVYVRIQNLKQRMKADAKEIKEVGKLVGRKKPSKKANPSR